MDQLPGDAAAGPGLPVVRFRQVDQADDRRDHPDDFLHEGRPRQFLGRRPSPRNPDLRAPDPVLRVQMRPHVRDRRAEEKSGDRALAVELAAAGDASLYRLLLFLGADGEGPPVRP